MSFQAYLDTIEGKTGWGPDALEAVSDAKGLSEKGKLQPGVKPGQIAGWLKAGLGHGHAMAVHVLLSGKKKPGD